MWRSFHIISNRAIPKIIQLEISFGNWSTCHHWRRAGCSKRRATLVVQPKHIGVDIHLEHLVEFPIKENLQFEHRPMCLSYADVFLLCRFESYENKY